MGKSEELLDRIDDRLIDIHNDQALTNTILVIVVILMIFLLVTSILICIGLSKLPKEKIESKAFVDEGCVQRIGKDSVMINNRVYDSICKYDLELVKIGDRVIIEKSNWFSGCNIYRLTVQEVKFCK